MKKLLVIAMFFGGQGNLATGNLNNEAHVIAYKAALDLAALPRKIDGLLNNVKFLTPIRTKASELKTRNDFAASKSKCYLATLLRTFPEEEASQLAEISGIDKDASYGQEVVEQSFWGLEGLHFRCIFYDNFQLAMRAKKGCKFLLDKYPDYKYTELNRTLTFAKVAENIKTPDDMGRELFGDPCSGFAFFFYPDDEEKARKIKDYEEMVFRKMVEEDEYECISD